MRLYFLSANNLSIQEINIAIENRNSHKMLHTIDKIRLNLWSKLIGSVTTSVARFDSEIIQRNDNTRSHYECSYFTYIALFDLCNCANQKYILVNSKKWVMFSGRSYCLNELSLSMIKIIILFESCHILFLDNLLKYLK